MSGDIQVNRNNRKAISEGSCNKWSALDTSMPHPYGCEQDDATVIQDGDQNAYTTQTSEEQIIVKDSCDIEVRTTDTQAAVNLQAALQVAISLIISISIGDSQKADQVTQELLQKIKVRQSNRQQTYIENSRGVNITTTDTDLAVNIQLLLQVLVAILVKLDIL